MARERTLASHRQLPDQKPATHRRHTRLLPAALTPLVLLLLMSLLLPQPGTAALYDITMGPPHEYDIDKGGRNNIVVPIDEDHYLCLYAGFTGKAVILSVDSSDWSLTTETTYEYDPNGDYMGVARIDPTHYLCTYCNDSEEASASVLSIDPADWSVATESTIIYDIEFGYYNALSPIDETHYLGVHNMWDVTGRAGVFTIDPADWSISYGTQYNFEPESGYDFLLSRIDATHHLCVYPSQGDPYGGRAVVLIVDPANWTVGTAVSPFTFATECEGYCFLSRIDDTHFLCAYQGPGSHGWTVVLTINPADWSVGMETPFEYDSGLGGEPCLSKIDDTHYLCAYKGPDADGYAVVLIVDPVYWTITRGTPLEHDPERSDYPYLCRIDAGHHLCSYEGPGSDGWAVVLEVEIPEVGIEEDAGIAGALMTSSYPNPFRATTTIGYRLPATGKVRLSIHDVTGQELKIVTDQSFPAGVHSVIWDGADARGKPVRSGIYFYRVITGDREAVRKLILAR